MPGFSPDDYMGGIRGPSAPSYSAPLVGTQLGTQLANLPAQYEAGQQRNVAQALRTAFPDGLPRAADGTIDSNAILNKIVSIGGLPESSLTPLMTLSARQSVAQGDVPPTATSGQPATPPPPATARSWLGLGNSPLASNDATGDVDSIRGLATEIFRGKDVSPYIPRFAAALKVDPDASLTPDQIATARRLMSKSASYLASQPAQTDENGQAASPPPVSGVSGAPGPSASGAGPSSAPLMSGAPAPQGPRMGQPGTQPADPAAGGGVRMQQPQRVGQAQPGADLVPPQLRHMTPPQAAAWLMSRAQRHSEIGDVEGAKLLAQQAQTIQDAIKQAVEPTPLLKESAAAGLPPGQYQAEVEGFKKYGEAKGKRIGEVVEAGGLPARQTVRTLNTMEEALTRGGSNISTGPGAEQWLKVKQGANNLFPGLFQGVPESETVQKLNAQLAAEAAKAMTARPSQLEFRAFMQNNPGLTTSVAGSKVLISVLRQAKEQDIALSRMAMNQDNLRNWTDVEDRFYAEHPIVGPWSQTATNSKTGEQVVLSGGKWIKVPK